MSVRNLAAPTRLLNWLIALAATAFAAAPVSAQNYYWNAPTGGAGTWDEATTSNWALNSGGPADQMWVNDGTITANFGNTAGNVTIADGANISAAALVFTTDGYLINRLTTGTLTLAGAGVIDTGTVNATIGAPIGGAVGLTKNGSGTLTSSGTNTYTGVTNVSTGTLLFTSTAALGATGAGNHTVVTGGASLTIGNNTISVGE